MIIPIVSLTFLLFFYNFNFTYSYYIIAPPRTNKRWQCSIYSSAELTLPRSTCCCLAVNPAVWIARPPASAGQAEGTICPYALSAWFSAARKGEEPWPPQAAHTKAGDRQRLRLWVQFRVFTNTITKKTAQNLEVKWIKWWLCDL